MKLKKSALTMLSAWLLMATSCQDVEPFAPSNDIGKENGTNLKSIGRLRFKSVADLSAAMQEVSVMRAFNVDGIVNPVDTAKGDDFKDVFTPVGDLEQYAQVDPIIALEMKVAHNTIENTQLLNDMQAYEAFGYDELVPETDFAKLLNVKGEIEVNDTVYKVSKTGTYFFQSSLYDHFANNLEKYEVSQGSKVADKTFLMDEGIYRYETFDSIVSAESADSDLPDSIPENMNAPYTPPLKTSYAEEVPWSKLPAYDADAKTIVGKIWQSLFGRNKSYVYQISKNRRVRGKFYYYNYRVHASTGALVEMQKKNWIGWSGTEAEGLTVNWHNIVFETKYQSSVPSGYYLNNTPQVSPAEDKVMIGFDEKVPVVSILGYDVSNNELNSLVSKSASEIYSYLKKKLGKPIPGTARAYMIYGENRIITIIPDGFIDGNHKKKIEKKFFDSWRFGVSFNLTNFASGWKSWLNFVNGMSINDPKLICGEVRVAASLDNKWGGMTITKKTR